MDKYSPLPPRYLGRASQIFQKIKNDECAQGVVMGGGNEELMIAFPGGRVVRVLDQEGSFSSSVKSVIHETREIVKLPEGIYERSCTRLIKRRKCISEAKANALGGIPVSQLNSEAFILKSHRTSYGSVTLKDIHYLDMERIEGESLGSYLEQLSSTGGELYNHQIAIVKECFDLVLSLKVAGLIHRDIKPENIIINPRDLLCVPIDFELSVFCKEEPVKSKYPFFSPGYSAPECCNKDENDNFLFTYKTDVYSLGAMMDDILFKPLLLDSPRSPEVSQGEASNIPDSRSGSNLPEDRVQLSGIQPEDNEEVGVLAPPPKSQENVDHNGAFGTSQANWLSTAQPIDQSDIRCQELKEVLQKYNKNPDRLLDLWKQMLDPIPENRPDIETCYEVLLQYLDDLPITALSNISCVSMTEESDFS